MTKCGFKFLTLGVLICGVTAAQAATTNATANAEETSSYKPFTIGAEAGTPGIGGSASWRFADHFGARAGFAYFNYSSSGDTFLGQQIEIVDSTAQQNVIGTATFDNNVRLMSEPLGLDIYPWKKSSFRITLGIMFNQNEQTGEVMADTVAGRTFLKIGNSTYDSASIGNVYLEAKQQPVSPYVSIAASYYFDKAKHWSLSGELGVAYTGTPDVTLSTGNPNSVNPADLNAVAQEMQDNAWKFYPILKLGVNYSF